MSTSEFVGRLKTFDDKKDEEIVDQTVLVELTDFKKDGTMELAFNDRNERCYLQIRLQDVIDKIAAYGSDG